MIVPASNRENKIKIPFKSWVETILNPIPISKLLKKREKEVYVNLDFNYDMVPNTIPIYTNVKWEIEYWIKNEKNCIVSFKIK